MARRKWIERTLVTIRTTDLPAPPWSRDIRAAKAAACAKCGSCKSERREAA